MHCHLPAATHNVRSHWMSPADGPASPSCTRAMPQAAAVAYTASTLGAAARCSKSTSFLPLMPLSRLVARHSRMLSRSYGGRVCGAVACVWPVLNRLLSVPCLGHKNRTRGAAQGPSKPRNRQMSQPGSPRAGPSREQYIVGAPSLIISTCISWYLPVSPGIPPYPARLTPSSPASLRAPSCCRRCRDAASCASCGRACFRAFGALLLLVLARAMLRR